MGIKVPTYFREETVKVVDPDVYYDIVDAPDPIPFLIRLKINNNEGLDLWFKVTPRSLPQGFNFTETELGLISDGGVGEFTITIQRTRPSEVEVPPPPSTLDEVVGLTLEAYKDSGYTDFYGLVNFDLTFHGLNSNDTGWTVVELANFDDGTLQDWTHVEERILFAGPNTKPPKTTVEANAYVSPPYSAMSRTYSGQTSSDMYEGYIGLEKTLDLSAYTKAYLVVYLRKSTTSATRSPVKDTKISIGDELFVFEMPEYGKWFKAVCPIRSLAITAIRIVTRHKVEAYYRDVTYSWIDDIKVIGK